MRPRVHLPTDLFYGGQILDNTMDKLVRSEALLTVKGACGWDTAADGWMRA